MHPIPGPMGSGWIRSSDEIRPESELRSPIQSLESDFFVGFRRTVRWNLIKSDPKDWIGFQSNPTRYYRISMSSDGFRIGSVFGFMDLGKLDEFCIEFWAMKEQLEMTTSNLSQKISATNTLLETNTKELVCKQFDKNQVALQTSHFFYKEKPLLEKVFPSIDVDHAISKKRAF